MVRPRGHLRYTEAVRASPGLWSFLAIGLLIAPAVAEEPLPAEPGETPAELLDRARRLALTDRPLARTLVDSAILRAEDDALRWDAMLWRCSDRERHEDDAAGSFAQCGPLWERVLAGDVPGGTLNARRRLETRTADVVSRALASLGRTEEARAVDEALQARDRERTGTPDSVDAPGPKDTPLDRARQASIKRWRDRLGVASWVVLGLFAALALPKAVRGARGAGRPVGALVVAGFALIAGGIGRGWEPGAGRFGWYMAAGFAAVHVLAALSLRPDGARWPLRLLAALATFACGFLAMQASSTLPWVGL